MKVLVCGGRDFGNFPILCRVLDGLHQKYGFTALIQGGARGADSLALHWARKNHVPSETFYANWTAEGHRAGPKRNQFMIDAGKPNLVVAFPGAAGTADLVRRAKAAKIPVLEIKLGRDP